MRERESAEQPRIIELERGEQASAVAVGRGLVRRPSGARREKAVDRQPVGVELQQRRPWVELDLVAARPVAVTGKPVGPRVQKWDAHERAVSRIPGHPGALPQQLFAVVHQRGTKHAGGRHPCRVQVGRFIVKPSGSKAFRFVLLDAVRRGVHAFARALDLEDRNRVERPGKESSGDVFDGFDEASPGFADGARPDHVPGALV